MRCPFLNFYPNLHLICYPKRGMIKDRPWFQLVPKVYSTSAPNVKSLSIFRPKEVKTCPLAPYVPPGAALPYIICIVSVKSYSHGHTCTSKGAG